MTTDSDELLTLLLDQVRHNGERQTVAPKGRIEPGETPLAAARREVAEETGLTDLTPIDHLGQESYRFTDVDGTSVEKIVDWFLFLSATTDVTPRREEGFHRARWLPLGDAADIATHRSFAAFIRRAAEIVAGRQARP